MKQTSYVYDLAISLLTKKKMYEIEQKSVYSIIISKDFEKSNIPTMYIGIKLSPDMYDILIKNNESATLAVTLSKVDDSSATALKEVRIQDNFVYMMDTNPNYNESITKAETGNTSNSSSDSYMKGHIGLLSLKSIADNKKLFNTIIKNSNLISIVHKFTNHMNMCIEPFDNNKIIDQIVIPPITSISSLLDFLNNNYSFYKSGYRYFRDYNYTYLLSNKGISTPTNNAKYNSVLISIRDALDGTNTKLSSMEIDNNSGAYILNVLANNITFTRDRVTDKKVNSIIGVDTNGDIQSVDLDLYTYSESTKKPMLQRIINNNFDILNTQKELFEGNGSILTIAVNDIDSEILTPNKEYNVKGYVTNRDDMDGRYILIYKKDIYFRKNDYMTCSTMLALRKVSGR